MQRRVEQPDRHRQPVHRARGCPRSRPAAWAARRSSAALALLRRRRPGSSPARPAGAPRLMNMCSVRQRPMPSAPNSRARAASSGVSALARTPSRRISSAQPTTGLEVLVDLRRHQRQRAREDLAGAAVDRDHVALGERRARRPDGARVDVDAQRLGSPPRRACPCRARRPPRARSCRRAPSARPARRARRGCRRASSPSAPGSTPSPAAAAALGGVGVEHDGADRRRPARR